MTLPTLITMVLKTIFFLLLAALCDAFMENALPLPSTGVQAITGNVSGPYCYSCDSVLYPSHCQHIKLCKEQEVCYTQQYTDSSQETVFRLGCRSLSECGSPPNPNTCMACCGTSHCNSLLCDTQAANHRLCYKCDDQIHPSFCDILVPCELKEEQCYFEKIVTDTYAIRYNAGCVRTRICTTIREHWGNLKRSEVLATICAGCCDSDKCNHFDCDHA